MVKVHQEFSAFVRWIGEEKGLTWHKSNVVLQAWQDNWDDGVEGDLNQMQILKGGLGAGDIG